MNYQTNSKGNLSRFERSAKGQIWLFCYFCQFSQKRSDNFSLFLLCSFLWIILINSKEMDFIELFKRSFSRSERSALAHIPIIISPKFENVGDIMFLVAPPPSPPPPHANACTGHTFVTNTPIKFTEGEQTLWWRFDDELWTRFVYVVVPLMNKVWAILINNDPVRQHDGSCSQTSHAKHAPVRK